MQDSERGPGSDEAAAGLTGAPTDGAAFAARVAAMSPAEREANFPNHSDGQVCR
jgi:hypothetical protein